MKPVFRRLVRFEDQAGTVFFGEAPSGDDLVGEEVSIYAGTNLWDLTTTNEKATIAKVLSPLPTVPIMYGIGLNYKTHIHETGLETPKYPLIFTKPPSALNGPFDDILVHPDMQNEMDYEGELIVVLGQDLKNAKVAGEALDAIIGYTVGNDVSARYWQRPEQSGGQAGYAKSADGFAPIGPVLVAPESIGGHKGITDKVMVTMVNGEERQKAKIDDLLFTVPDLLVHMSRGTTIKAGTIIFTGTPAGVAIGFNPPKWLKNGDVVEVSIESIGKIRNKYVFE
ncbi:fumarylacetoacetate hydrolase family protein [Thozetella sp. PMI_491]|nr:fumarylacetoacetate hydrolase family protein [Thozetella sp. PMI_491]